MNGKSTTMLGAARAASLALLLAGSAGAAGNAPQPPICSRACWGAQSSGLNTNMAALNRAIIHHTAGSGDYNVNSQAESAAKVRAIQSYHVGLGWGDIGYHFLVDKLGNAFEGRLDSLNKGTQRRGAHDGTNTNSFGFNFLGYYHPPHNNALTTAAKNKMYDLIAWRMPNGWSPYGSGTYNGSNVGFLDGHRDVKSTACPGDLIYNTVIGTNHNAGEARNEVNARINGATPANPPYYFDANGQGFTSGNSMAPLQWTNQWGWPGVVHAQQNGPDAFIYSPPTNFPGSGSQVVHARVYPQFGTTPDHDMQVFWKTASSNVWDAAKSSNIVSFTAQDEWFNVVFALNGNWAGQTITQLRVDFDQNNQQTNWLVDFVRVEDIVQPDYHFTSGAQGFWSGSGLAALGWTDQWGWPGIVHAQQNAADAFMYGPLMYRTGAAGDWVKVRVHPQFGTTANHDMQIFWTTNSESSFSAERSTAVVNYTAQDQWAELCFPVGDNPKWNGDTVIQLRVDFDQANTQTNWLVDSIEIVNDIVQPPYAFASGAQGFTAGNGLAALDWTDQWGWPGIVYGQQNAADAYAFGPPLFRKGTAADWIKVRVYPQFGSTASHNMQIFWTTDTGLDFSAARSSSIVNYSAQDAWADVYVPVGSSAEWNGKNITRLRLDFDQTNTNTNWIVDSIEITGAP